VKDSAATSWRFRGGTRRGRFLGIGAAAALATHPADHYVETHIVGNDTANRVFSLGQWVGSTYVQVGSAVGLWVVGRYVVAPAADQPRTNKYSELGFDLIRAQILSQSIVHGMKYSIRRDRPTGECCAFPSGTRRIGVCRGVSTRAAFRAIARRGRRWRRRRMWHLSGSWTAVTS
jgi:hypothetical protein